MGRRRVDRPGRGGGPFRLLARPKRAREHPGRHGRGNRFGPAGALRRPSRGGIERLRRHRGRRRRRPSGRLQAGQGGQDAPAAGERPLLRLVQPGEPVRPGRLQYLEPEGQRHHHRHRAGAVRPLRGMGPRLGQHQAAEKPAVQQHRGLREPRRLRPALLQLRGVHRRSAVRRVAEMGAPAQLRGSGRRAHPAHRERHRGHGRLVHLQLRGHRGRARGRGRRRGEGHPRQQHGAVHRHQGGVSGHGRLRCQRGDDPRPLPRRAARQHGHAHELRRRHPHGRGGRCGLRELLRAHQQRDLRRQPEARQRHVRRRLEPQQREPVLRHLRRPHGGRDRRAS